MKRKRLWVAVSLLLIACLAMPPGGAVAAGDGAAPAVKTLTLKKVLGQAVARGKEAESARLKLEESLLEVADMRHQHEMGPPRGHSITLPGAEEGETFTVTLGEPSRLEKAEIEKLLPLQADVTEETACAVFRQRMASLRAEVIEAYLSAVLAAGELELKEASLNRLREHHRRAEALFSEGQVARMDVLRTEAAVSGGEAAVSSVRSGLERAMLRLKELIGMDLDQRVRLADYSHRGIPPAPEVKEDVEIALSASAEVVSARARLAVAEKELELFVDCHGSFTERRSYYKRWREVREAGMQLKEARREVKVKVRNNHCRLTEVREGIAAADRRVQLMRRVAEISRLRYREGLAPVTELLDAAVDLRKAELARLEARMNHRVLRAEREALLGVLPGEVEGFSEQMLEEIDQLK